MLQLQIKQERRDRYTTLTMRGQALGKPERMSSTEIALLKLQRKTIAIKNDILIGLRGTGLVVH